MKILGICLGALLQAVTLVSADQTCAVSQQTVNAHNALFIAQCDAGTDAFTISTNGFPYLRQSQVASSAENDLKNPLFSHRVGTLRIVEYNDTIGPDQSTSGCSFVDKGDQFATLSVDNFGIGTGVNAYHVSTIFTGGSECPSITFMVDAMVVSQPYQVYGQTFQPDEIAQWFTLSGFPYQMQNSKLAFVQVAQSKQPIAVNSTVSKLTFGNTDYAYVFDYPQYVNGNTSVPLSASVWNNKLFDVAPSSAQDDGAIDGEKNAVFYMTVPEVQPQKIQFMAALAKRKNENPQLNTTVPTEIPTAPSSPSGGSGDNSESSSASLSASFNWAIGLIGFLAILFIG